MKRAALLTLLCLLPIAAAGQEMTGQLGSRNVLVVVHAVQRPDGGWRLAGEYVILPTLQRRYLEGERSPQLGVTTLREGASPIFFGHPLTGELRGTWRGGVLKGTRYGPGGQERERFEFSERFPSMESYSAKLRCAASHGRYAYELAYTVESGAVRAFEWRSRVEPGGHSCELGGLQQQRFEGGLRLTAGECSVTLRELGDWVRIAAEGCSRHCGSQAWLEPTLADRRGNCRLLQPEAR